MKSMHFVAEQLIAKAESFAGITAGIANLSSVLGGQSYKAIPNGNWEGRYSEKTLSWIPGARSLLVLAMYHPESNPELDWYYGGNTLGNRKLTDISNSLVAWLLSEHCVHAQSLPYHRDRGGVFLKDAAVFAGVGIVGKNNLLIHRQWGPRVRLRSVLIQEDLPSASPPEDFSPCRTCAGPCLEACPEGAFKTDGYHRPACIKQMNADLAKPLPVAEIDINGGQVPVTKWCRRCELACTVGL